MEFWNKARNFAEEAAKRSQELTIGSSRLSDIVSETAKRSKELAAEASKRSQELAIGNSRISEIVSETAKRSKEFAVEASKRADQIKVEAIKRADQIKSSLAEGPRTEQEKNDLETFGVTDELREFVKGITINTFQDFPLEDDTEVSDVPTVSNVRQDLTEWQEKHAHLVLKSVKEISKLRYELCPRIMRERKFWRIYFLLVSSHVASYEKRYMENKLKSAEVKDDEVKEPSTVETAPKSDKKASNRQSKTSTSSSTEQDLDVFLLGDMGDSDDGPDDGDEGFDDDFDKMVDTSDDERKKS